jgi:hypothetical protein
VKLGEYIEVIKHAKELKKSMMYLKYNSILYSNSYSSFLAGSVPETSYGWRSVEINTHGVSECRDNPGELPLLWVPERASLVDVCYPLKTAESQIC